jgi:hypothetical protein
MCGAVKAIGSAASEQTVHDPRRIGGDAVDVGPVDERNGNGID